MRQRKRFQNQRRCQKRRLKGQSRLHTFQDHHVHKNAADEFSDNPVIEWKGSDASVADGSDERKEREAAEQPVESIEPAAVKATHQSALVEEETAPKQEATQPKTAPAETTNEEPVAKSGVDAEALRMKVRDNLKQGEPDGRLDRAF